MMMIMMIMIMMTTRGMMVMIMVLMPVVVATAVRKMTSEDRAHLLSELNELTGRGMRVLGLARAEGGMELRGFDASLLGKATFVGMLAFEDPVRWAGSAGRCFEMSY
jgi:magnesium-transporting ATPase (P-type)